MQMLLGFYSYYGRYICHFAYIAAPLYTLLYKEVTWHYADIEEFAMLSLCTALCSQADLALPDFSTTFCIETDASDTAVGDILT